MKWESCGKKPGNSPPEVARIFSGGMNQARRKELPTAAQGAVSVKPRFRSTRRGRPPTAFHEHFTRSPERGIDHDTLQPTPESFQSPMEHRNEAHTTTANLSLQRYLPPAAGLPCPSAACDSALFRCCSKNFEVQNLSSSPPLALPFDCDSLVLRLSYEPHTNSAQTSPGGRAPVTRARMRRRPLPVDLEKFRSPKTLHFPSSYHSLFPSTATRSSCDFPTKSAPTSPDGRAPVPLGRMRQRPLPVDPEIFTSPKPLVLATTRCRLHHLICPSTATRSSRNFHTSLAPTSPDGRAPVTGARIPQRPLPADLEKFRSPKQLHFLFSSSSLATSLHPSTATR
ncbi:hypothetical protein TNCT_497801 [Trichonephila clavata]|uniref:Uncharacterized protein n=1 Tax=Trichonephila clavata TaxID=2740835 RepID=A0A8X6II60_TRICU|nr:hypothetical protein TNCT_497801 [Trichonephila clavata]